MGLRVGWSSLHRQAGRPILLRRCGRRDTRLIAVPIPPPNDLSRIFDDRGPLDGGHILADSMLDSLISHWRNNQRYLLTSGSYGFEPKVLFVDTHTRGGCRKARKGLRKSQYHHSATLAGRQSNCWRLGSGSQTALPDSTVTVVSIGFGENKL